MGLPSGLGSARRNGTCRMNYDRLPEHMQDGFKRYFEDRIPMGSFGMAVVSNDLKEAFGRADEVNRERMFDIVSWLYNNAPIGSWGSPENVEAWLAARKV